MKSDGLLKFLGNCIIAVAIIVASCIIAFHLPDTTRIPASLSVNTQSEQAQFGDYLSRYEVAHTSSANQPCRSGLSLGCPIKELPVYQVDS